MLGDTDNKWAVRILLECNLVDYDSIFASRSSCVMAVLHMKINKININTESKNASQFTLLLLSCFSWHSITQI